MENKITTIEMIKKVVEYIGGEIDIMCYDMFHLLNVLAGKDDSRINYDEIIKRGKIIYEDGFYIGCINEDGVICGNDGDEENAIIMIRYEYLSEKVLEDIFEYLMAIINIK